LTNWRINEVLIRGSAEEIKKYKDSLLKGGTDLLDQIEPLGELVDLLRRMGPM
jgi:hypothetical protein